MPPIQSASVAGVGGGLKDASSSYYKELMLSPRMGARRGTIDRMNNTVTGGSLSNDLTGGLASLQVTGARKDGWENPNSSAKNGLNIRDHDISIQDVIDVVLKKPAFGFEGYEPTPTHKYTFPVKTHVAAKAKRRMFCEEASKRADKIPAASKY